MTNLQFLTAQPSACTFLPVAAAVRRTPFYFESQGQWLFAWLHCREHAGSSDHGVILCPPLGHEQVHAHRSLRHLADALAAAGFPVVRFDYHGTGDSAGTDEDADRVATWLVNIGDAQSWLKQQLGCTRLSLVGLRVGATLAVQAATEQAVDGLLLWSPVLKGRAYVREMKALDLTAAGRARSPDGTGSIEAAGFVLTGQTVQDLSRLDLLQARPRCRRALLLTRDDAPTDGKVREHFQELGIDVQQTAAPGYADMMAEPHYNKVPHEAIARMVDWLRTGSDKIAIVSASHPSTGSVLVGEGEAPAEPISPARQEPRPPQPGHYPFPESGYTRHAQHLLCESVLHVSAQPPLFGILSEPVDTPRADLPFLVLVNAGSSYRVGPNRLYVALSRQLAAQGFRCLRMDLCGLGDSVCPDPRRENDPYPATAFRDIDLTLAHLRAHFGARRVVLMGLCSGAYAAFQAAAQLSSSILVESVFINPLTFFWRDGMSLEASPAQQLKAFQECMTSIRRPAKWLKVLCGRSKLGIFGGLRLLVQRWRLRDRIVAAGGSTTARDRFPSHPHQEDVPGDLDRIVKAGRHLACFFARTDPGHGILMLRAGRKVSDLQCAGQLHVYLLDDADHTFSRRSARSALGQALTKHLLRRYAAPGK